MRFGPPVGSNELRRFAVTGRRKRFAPGIPSQHGPMTSASSKPAITLDQLIALNDEIVALVRAGVPLDRGLRSLGEDLPGRLGRFAGQLSERIARGESLTDALAEPTLQTCRGFTVRWSRRGLRQGVCRRPWNRWPARCGGWPRRGAASCSSLTYPLLLFLLAWGLFAFSASKLTPAIYHSFQEFHLAGGEWFAAGCPSWLSRPGFGDRWYPRSCWCWPGCGGWARKTAAWRKASAQLGSSAGFRGWAACCDFRGQAVFVEVLKLLVENRLPLDQAVTLAAEAAGDAALSEAAQEFAAAIRRGEPALAAASRACRPC